MKNTLLALLGLLLLSSPRVATAAQSGYFTYTSSGSAITITGYTAPAAWVPLQSLNLTNGAFYFSDPNWTNYSARNYRIRSP